MEIILIGFGFVVSVVLALVIRSYRAMVAAEDAFFKQRRLDE